MKAIKIPEKTVSRLSIYLRCVEELENEGAALEEILGFKQAWGVAFWSGWETWVLR